MTITTTALEPLELPMPEPEDEDKDDFDPYPEYDNRDHFERAQWFGERAKRPEPTTTRLSKTSTRSTTTKYLSEDDTS